MRAFVLICLAIAPGVLTAAATAQATGRIEGSAVDGLGDPIPLARLQLTILMHPPRTATCDAQGC